MGVGSEERNKRSMTLIVRINIARPAAVVFAFGSAYAHDPQWRTGVIEMIQTPPGRPSVGTKTREVARFFGRRMITPGEVTAYEPDRVIAFAGLMANQIPVSGKRSVELVGEHARCTYQVTVELRGVYQLLKPLLAARLRQRFMGDLRRLKKLLEAPAVVDPS